MEVAAELTASWYDRAVVEYMSLRW
jgi:hypothetical protein